MKCSAPCSAVLRHSPSSWAAVVYTYAVANPIRGHKEVTMSTGAAALGRNPVSISTRFSLSMEMSRLTRDGTAEPVSRDQILRHERGQGNIHFFPVQLTTCRTGNLTRLIHSLATIYMCDHTYIHYIHTYIMVTTRYSRPTQGSKSRQKVMRLYKQWHRPISKRFIKPPYSISRAASIDSDCCRQLTTSVLSNKANRLRSNPTCFDQQVQVSQGHTSYKNKEK